MNLFIDRIHRLPRVWSNHELARFAPRFTGDVVNVSAWKDIDKEGRRYRDYFTAASSYTITNFKAEARGFQGMEGEVFLDLERPLPPDLAGRFDVVFNHTTLEHIYGVAVAFSNLCRMSRDIVIVVAPFLQQMHGDYGDYWRFTPSALARMFSDNGFAMLYQSFNTHPKASVYTFSIASRQPENWRNTFPPSMAHVHPGAAGDEPFIGCRAIPNVLFRLAERLRRIGRA